MYICFFVTIPLSLYIYIYIWIPCSLPLAFSLSLYIFIYATRADKDGNDIADATADIGVSLHGDGVVELANAYNKRHCRYTEFMFLLVRHIVEAHMIHRELVRIEEAKADKMLVDNSSRWIYTPLDYVQGQHIRKIDFTSSITRFAKPCAQDETIVNVEDFLKTLCICEAKLEVVRGITWIELYVLYRISGNAKPLNEKPCEGKKFRQAVPLDMQVKHFKTQVRRIADRALIGGRDEQRFRPHCVIGPNLQNVGFEGKHAAVGFDISINKSAQRQINKALILLGRTLSKDKVDQIIDQKDTKPTKLVKLSFKAKVGWDSRLDGMIFSTVPDEGALFEHSLAHESAHVDKRFMHVVQCPTCNKQSPSQQYKFQYRDLDIKIECSECHKFSPIKAWNCNCGVLWHTCKVHTCTENVEPTMKSQTLSKSRIEKTGSGKASSKRLHSNALFEEILDDDLRSEAKRAKKSLEQDETLARVLNPVLPFKRELRASMLSQNIRQRFAHLLA